MKTFLVILVLLFFGFSVNTKAEENTQTINFTEFIEKVEEGHLNLETCAGVLFYLDDYEDENSSYEDPKYNFDKIAEFVFELKTHKLVEEYIDRFDDFEDAVDEYKDTFKILLTYQELKKHDLNEEEFNRLVKVVSTYCYSGIIRESKKVIDDLYEFKLKSIRKLTHLPSSN